VGRWDKDRVMRLLGGGLILLVAVLLAALLAAYLAQDIALWAFGRDVKADVVERWVEQVGTEDEGELQFEYYVKYRFAAEDGQTLTVTTTVGLSEWASGDGSGQVDVVYFPPCPQHNRLDDSRYVPLLACTYVPVILIAAAMLAASWQLFRPAIQGRIGEGEEAEENTRARRRDG
jgi:hypothetical protein